MWWLLICCATLLVNCIAGAAVCVWLDGAKRYNGRLFVLYSSMPHVELLGHFVLSAWPLLLIKWWRDARADRVI